jgi:[ribosomal protein S18]-alanine N-acetyltransferase
MSARDKLAVSDVSVRPAGPDDFESLHDVDGRVFGELAYPYFVLRQLFDAFPECWLVAAGPTGLVGYSVGLPSVDRTCAWLFGLAVDSNHRNRGYGTRLTQETLDLLGSLGVATVYLTVEPGNGVASRLYRRFGFSEAGDRENYFGPGEHRLLMTRSLQAVPAPRPDQA